MTEEKNVVSEEVEHFVGTKGTAKIKKVRKPKAEKAIEAIEALAQDIHEEIKDTTVNEVQVNLDTIATTDPENIGKDLKHLAEDAQARIQNNQAKANSITLPGTRKQRRQLAKAIKLPWETVKKITDAENRQYQLDKVAASKKEEAYQLMKAKREAAVIAKEEKRLLKFAPKKPVEVAAKAPTTPTEIVVEQKDLIGVDNAQAIV